MSLKFLPNHVGDLASSLAMITGSTASGDIYDLISGPRNTYWRGTASSSAVSPGYSLAANYVANYLVIARADKMVTLAGSQVRAMQKSSGGSWSAISGTTISTLAAANLTGYRSQDLVIDVSGATNYRGYGIEMDSAGTEAMTFTKMYASAGFSFAMPPVFAQPWVDIPESDRWFRPQQTSYEYETEKQFKLGFPATRAEMTSFKALPMLLKWPLFLYDTAGDVFPWKLEHVVIEGWIETVIEDDRHFVEITLRRLKHYP